ncbi:hyphally-regulated protein-like [Nilaparvata lugens]|uniref:hyphally-regulated protein-like n=1 Tax=Nilaparvata lugens TaxID=108931 RepID=UPI00193E8D78|nr:hyphally-regulated protein-like [Nilaparvata lugens]
MKSTEPLSLSPKKLNFVSNSTRNQQSATLNGESLSKPQLVTKMVETSEIENNVCDTSKQTVEVHVHQENGYSSEDCSQQEKFVDSGRGREVVNGKRSPNNCSSESERSCTKLSSSSGNGGLRSELETGCTKSTVNDGSRSKLDMNCTKPSLTSRDSAVFDVDLASGDDEISCFEEATSSSKGADEILAATPVEVGGVSLVNGYKKNSQDPLLQKLSSPVKTNGESLVNGYENQSEDSLLKTLSTPVKSNCVSLVNGDEKSAQDSLSSREIKTVSGDVERKQRTGSIFSKNGLRDSFKNMKRSIVGSSSNGLVENRRTLKDVDQKSGTAEGEKISSSDGEHRNGVLQGSGDQNPSSFGVTQGTGDQNPSSFGVTQGTGDQNPSSFGVTQGTGDQNPSSFGVTQGSSGHLQGLGVIAKCSNGPHLAKASSLESLSDAGGRFERDSELRRSKSSMNGFCSGRSRSDPDEDIDDLLLPGGRQNNEGFDHLPVS